MAPRAAKDKPVRNGSPKKGSAKARAAKDASKTATATRRGRRAPGKQMNLVERVLLAQRIAVARHKPVPDTWPVIAKREGVPQRTCEHVYSKHREQAAALEDPTGQKVLDETLAIYTETIALLGEATSQGESWAVRTGAARTLLDAARARVELLVVMGRMPRSIQASRDRQRVQVMLRRMAELLERHSASPELIRDLLGILDDEDEHPVIEASVSALPAP